MKIMRIGTMAVAVLALSAQADDIGEGNSGLAIPPKPAASDGQIVVYENVETGRLSPQNGVCGAPRRPGTANYAAWKAAAFPYSRTHDMNTCLAYGAPYVIDVPWIFRDFDADENDPKNYEFACTDAILQRMLEAGTEPFYRLGGPFEANLVKKYNIYPPKDPAKWARICEHIIAHYTEGWANGFKWKMEHWEIWNEPNHNTKNDNGAKGSFWCGPRDEFKRLWKTAQLHLKARFPHLKIGGAGFAGPEREWGGEILREFAAEKVPLDFYSWHDYGTDPARFGRSARCVREMLDGFGYTNTLSVVDEWNYVAAWNCHGQEYSAEVWAGRLSHKSAAFIAASMIEFDAADVDVGMFYDARIHGMNPIFNDLTGRPLRGYYPFIAWRNLLRLGTRVKTTSDFTNGVWTVAAKGTDGRIGALVVRYSDDDGEYYPKRVTLRLASGASLADASFHMTDRDLVHTAFDPEPNADGSVDVMMYPCSFVLVETKPLSGASRCSTAR